MTTGPQPDARDADYEVLSPWADVDPVPLRGIAPRLTELAGRRIGIFLNQKRAAQMTAQAFERELLERFPGASTSWYDCTGHNIPEALTDGFPRFEAWVRSVDAVVLSVAD